MTQLQVTRKEAKELEAEIKKAENKLRELKEFKIFAAKNEGNILKFDNFAFEQAVLEEAVLIKQIEEMRELYENAKIIRLDRKTKNVVKIGKRVVVKLDCKEVGTSEYEFYLTGSLGNTSKNIISIHSPLGENILNREVGFKGEYKVNNNEIRFEILNVI